MLHFVDSLHTKLDRIIKVCLIAFSVVMLIILLSSLSFLLSGRVPLFNTLIAYYVNYGLGGDFVHVEGARLSFVEEEEQWLLRIEGLHWVNNTASSALPP